MLTGKQAVGLLDEKRWPLCEMLGHYKAQSSEKGICITGKLDILENY